MVSLRSCVPPNHEQANVWLDSSNDIMNNAVVKAAAIAVGPTLLLMQASQFEAAGDVWRASKRYASAGFTPALIALQGGTLELSSDGVNAPANARAL